jgi:short-subunit dehydrogenase
VLLRRRISRRDAKRRQGFEHLAAFVDEVERNPVRSTRSSNNAGYGHEGTLEESSIVELRQQFEVNVFGPVSMMKAVLSHMRARGFGILRS